MPGHSKVGELAGQSSSRQHRKVTAEGSWQPGAAPRTSGFQRWAARGAGAGTAGSMH